MNQLNFPNRRVANACSQEWSQSMLSRLAGLVFLVLVIFAMPSAMAGEFFEKNGAAIDGFDTVAYFTEKRAVRGDKTITASHKGSTFHFSNTANRELFVANPEKYAPQFDGFCAYGVSQGAKAKIEGERFKVVNGKLYLNYDESIQSTWNEDIPGYIKQAEQNWPALK